jgi:hypothetical protein
MWVDWLALDAAQAKAAQADAERIEARQRPPQRPQEPVPAPEPVETLPEPPRTPWAPTEPPTLEAFDGRAVRKLLASLQRGIEATEARVRRALEAHEAGDVDALSRLPMEDRMYLRDRIDAELARRETDDR